MDRPWARYYPEGASSALPPIPWRHVAAILTDTVARYGDQTAFTLVLPNGSAGSLTFAEVDRLSDHLALYLREEAGFGPGDRIALQMPNCLAYPVCVFACLKAGLVMVNTNPLYTPAEMTHQFADSGATGLIVIDLFADRVAQVLPRTAIRTVLVVGLADLMPTITRLVVTAVQRYVKRMLPPITFAAVRFDRALARGAALAAAGRTVEGYGADLTHDTLCALQYTGGTTGVAKGAMLTHGNLLANIVQCLAMWRPWLSEGREVILTALPLYHIFAFTANLMLFVAVGGRNVLVPTPRPPSNVRKALLGQPITWVTGVSTLFAALLRESWFRAHKGWAFRGTVAGGMALAPSVGQEWMAVTGTPIYQGYGLTESSPVALLNPFQRPKLDAIGIPMPGTEIRIVDGEGQDVRRGEPGELLVAGPQVMRGYWQQPEETASTLRDGWLHTGDMATMDDEGYVSIVDRKKDMILVSGFNVYPNEVETALLTCPGVAEAAVIGVSDERSGEVVHAFVVARDPQLTEETVRAHCRASLTSYKVPKRVTFRQDLPKSPVGKVLRKDLRPLLPAD